MDPQTVLLTPERVSADATTAAGVRALPRFDHPLSYPTRKRLMNLRAIDDLLETILSQWYGSVALWAAPGTLSDDTCPTCGSGLVAGVIDVSAWPHDLMHSLETALEAAVAQIAASFAEDELGCLAADHRCARELVSGALTERAADLVDVLSECVTVRIDRFVGFEVERGLRELDRLPDAR